MYADSPPAAIRNSYVPSQRRSSIHPIFGKRSTDEKPLTKVDKFHMNLHRSTRQSLYRRLSRLLDT